MQKIKPGTASVHVLSSQVSKIIFLGYSKRYQLTVSKNAADFYLIVQKVSFLVKLFHFFWFFKTDHRSFCDFEFLAIYGVLKLKNAFFSFKTPKIAKNPTSQKSKNQV